MKELDPLVLLAVFHEMLGLLLWPVMAVVLLGSLAFAALLIRERAVMPRRLLAAQALGLLGGALALALMVQVSSSGFIEPGGPADWFLIALVFGLGVIGSTILAYTTAGWWSMFRRPAGSSVRQPSRFSDRNQLPIAENQA